MIISVPGLHLTYLWKGWGQVLVDLQGLSSSDNLELYKKCYKIRGIKFNSQSEVEGSGPWGTWTLGSGLGVLRWGRLSSLLSAFPPTEAAAKAATPPGPALKSPLRADLPTQPLRPKEPAWLCGERQWVTTDSSEEPGEAHISLWCLGSPRPRLLPLGPSSTTSQLISDTRIINKTFAHKGDGQLSSRPSPSHIKALNTVSK